MLEDLGNELQLPHSRSLGKGLFELRERRFGYRLYYCFKGNKLIILLVAGDKKSQDKDIKTAYKRMERIMKTKSFDDLIKTKLSQEQLD